jgi:nitrogen regulatory protein PII
MKKVEIITPNGHLADVHNVLKELNVGGMSHYGIEGAGRIKADPVVAATHPTSVSEYILRHKVEVVVKDSQVEPLITKIRERLSNEPQGGKIFVTDVPIAVDISTNKRGEEVI